MDGTKVSAIHQRVCLYTCAYLLPVIYPLDFRQNGHIVDDDMHAMMVGCVSRRLSSFGLTFHQVEPLPKRCRLTVSPFFEKFAAVELTDS